MNKNKSGLLICLIFITSIFFLSGCAVFNFFKPPVQDIKALNLVQEIKNRNKGIETCKGTGWLTLSSKTGKVERFRMAWAASFPDKLRMTLLSSGHPVETIIADGKRVIIVSHTGNHSPQTINSADPSLKNIISIPVTMQDVISLLAGRMPMIKFDYAYILPRVKNKDIQYNRHGRSIVIDSGHNEKMKVFKKTNPDKDFDIETRNTEKVFNDQTIGQILALKKKWAGKTQKIFIDTNQNILGCQFFDQDKKPYYSISYSEYLKYEPFTIPARINLNENSGNHITIEITAYMANIPIKSSVFNLTDQR